MMQKQSDVRQRSNLHSNRPSPPDRRPPQPPWESPYLFYSFIALLIGLPIVIGIHSGNTISWYGAWIIGWSITTFLMYGLDKALVGSLRVPEKVLHGLAIIGGGLGGLMGMFLFFHKIRHPKFLIILLISTALHCYLAASAVGILMR